MSTHWKCLSCGKKFEDSGYCFCGCTSEVFEVQHKKGTYQIPVVGLGLLTVIKDGKVCPTFITSEGRLIGVYPKTTRNPYCGCHNFVPDPSIAIVAITYLNN